MTTQLRLRLRTIFCVVFPAIFSSTAIAQLDESTIDSIKTSIVREHRSWTAGENEITRLSESERRDLLGGLPPEPGSIANQRGGYEELPPNITQFFSWGDNGGLNWMTPIRAQGGCGACWSFAAAGAFEAKQRILLGQNNLAVDVSEQNMISCWGFGCNALSLDTTLARFQASGSPDESCFPYSSNGYPPVVPSCGDRCTDWAQRSYIVQEWGRYVSPSVVTIKNEIQFHGPVAVGMTVYTDFLSYNGGVYYHVYGVQEGGHTVVLYGWDDDNSCWLAKNSWGTGWGEIGPDGTRGWFRILMGSNESNCESWVYWVDPFAAPTNCQASDTDCGAINITWDWSGLTQTGFKVFRDNNLVYTGSSPAQRSWLDNTVSPGTYSYTVRAYNNVNNGPQSNADSGTRISAPAQVQHVTASEMQLHRVVVTWNDLQGENGYIIYRDGDSTGIVTSNVTTFSDYPNAGCYVYSVSAFNNCGTGTQSLPDRGCYFTLPTSPEPNQLDVPPNTDIAVLFDIPMDPASINESTFLVSASVSGPHTGAIAYNSISHIATMNPGIDFAPGEVATATLTTGIRSFEGVPLDSSYSWSFTIMVNSSQADFDSSDFTPLNSAVYWVICADINGDHCLDMATANTGANSISVLFNDCSGNFVLDQTYPAGTSPYEVAAADFNGDGHIDLASADSGSGTISVFLNQGDGTFAPAVSYLTGVGAWGLCCADFNGDGDIDIAVSTGSSGHVAIFENDGDGTFPIPPTQILSTGEGAYGIFEADFNSDYQPDIAVTTGSVHSIETFLNNGDGSYPPTPSGSYETDGSSWGLFAADFNGDGYVDLASTNPDQMRVTVQLNQGDGTFPVISGSYETPGSSWGIFGGDFDGDGDIDLAVTIPDSGTVFVMMNNGDGVFLPELNGSYETPGSAWGVFSADMNGDETMDLAVANTDPNGVSELWNAPSVYQYFIGDVNGSQNLNGLDVTYGVSYFKGGGPAPWFSGECPPGSSIWYICGDVNASCSYNGLDVTYLVSYFKGGPGPVPCADCPPAR